MTIGTVTMSWFGWMTLCMEMICITLKDTYLWKDNLEYRYGVKKEVGSCILIGAYIIAAVASEFGGLSGQIGIKMFLFLLVVFLLYFLTENGLEVMGRIVIYWVICYLPWLAFGSLTNLFPYMSEGNVVYYEAPAQVLPNICILLIAFFTMLYLWKRRVLHWIPKEVCIALNVFANSTEYIRFIGVTGDNKVTLFEIQKMVIIILVYAGIAMAIVMFHSSRQKRKMQLAVLCRKMFYQQISKAQKEAGKFRHDLANHMQVLNTYGMRQDAEEKEKYAKKLNERKQELQIQTYSGNVVMDFVLNQIQNMAESNGCYISVKWEAGEVTEEEIERITDSCLAYMAKRYHWWKLYDRMGKKNQCRLTVLKPEGEKGACRVEWKRL